MPMKLRATVDDWTERVPPIEPDWAWFLDVDGTLLEIAAHPAEVKTPAALVPILAALHERAGTPVALISGRTIEDLDWLFAPLRLPSAGQHGAERRDSRGRTHAHSGTDPLFLAVKSELIAFVRTRPGLMLEDKGSTMAMHFRKAPEYSADVELVVRMAAERLGDGYEVQPGKMIYEIRPQRFDKGKAIAEFLGEPPFSGRRPVFLGDDVTDEHGFAMVNRLGGHSIKVGPGPTAARWRLGSVAAVVQWLAGYIETFG